MAAIASPLPLSFSSSANEFHRPAARSISRMAYSRSYGHRSPQEPSRRRAPAKQSSGDSSDDDDLAPIKLSAEAQAILGEEHSQAGSDKENINIYARKTAAEKAALNINGPTPVDRVRTTSSRIQGNGSPAPRVSHTIPPPRPALTTAARDGSFMYRTVDRSATVAPPPSTDSHTPPRAKRVIRVSTGRRSSRITNGISISSTRS